MSPRLANPRANTAVELKAQIDAERAGMAFLVFRDEDGGQVIFRLSSEDGRIVLGRGPATDIALGWDERVSRIHAELERIADRWSLVDDGLSLNGSYANGTIVHGRRVLHDGDRIELGGTVILFRDPAEADARSTAAASERRIGALLSELQRATLLALCRPYKDHTAFVTPATNEQIAAELYLSVDAVKKHLRVLFEKFGVADLPQYEKRTRLVERAFASGFLSEHDL
ncbi:MAG TPA: FHA domain-containing protein [Thermoleophilaceae bacterium]|nr:FHA domain-containing protein [Thermoleophilaceae bacterium]